MRRGNIAPSNIIHSRKDFKSGRHTGNALLLVEGTTLKGTVCEKIVSYLIKLFYSQLSLFLNTPRIAVSELIFKSPGSESVIPDPLVLIGPQA